MSLPSPKLAGRIFGRLTVLGLTNPIINKKGWKISMWLCKCSCGKTVKVRLSELREKGGTKSCGCLREDYRKYGNHNTNTIHGMSKTYFYKKWGRMNGRCNDKNKEYYFQRGIKVCDKWKKFENFKDDMYGSYLIHSKKYGEKNTSIERRDNNKGYSLDNCTWVTLLKQSSNKRNNKFIEWRGVKKTYANWGKYLGGNGQLVSDRLRKGWTVEEIMTTPFKNNNLKFI